MMWAQPDSGSLDALALQEEVHDVRLAASLESDRKPRQTLVLFLASVWTVRSMMLHLWSGVCLRLGGHALRPVVCIPDDHVKTGT